MGVHKAVQVHAFAEDGPAAACQIESVETPKPGEKQVLLKMLCRPINPSDVFSVQGQYPGGPSSFPFVPGFEGVGKVHELGEGVTGLQLGQRVFSSSGGTWQEFLVAPQEALIPVPDSVPDEVAAQFFVNPWTVYGMLSELAVPEGDFYVLQTAAASVLGRMFIQLAHHKGVKTINLVRRNEQKEELKAIGADEVINYQEEDVVEQVRKITNGKMAYAAIDCVGGQTTKVVCSSLRDGGTVIVYGALDGFEANVGISDLIFRDVKVHGFHVAKWASRLPGPDEFPKVGAEIMGLLVKGVIKPLVGKKFPLEKITEAIIHSQSAARGGKVLLVSE